MPHSSDSSVIVTVPARAASLVSLRAVVGAMATGMRFSLDAIDDMRLAVDEAVSLLLGADRSASTVEMRLEPTGEDLVATVGTDSQTTRWPPPAYRSGLPWQVISGLTDAASAFRSTGGRPMISFSKRRAPTDRLHGDENG